MHPPSHQSTKFEHLPSEVIIHCLTFLSFIDLQNCRLVSHQLNNLISNSAEIMRKFKFIIQFSIDFAANIPQPYLKSHKDVDDLWDFLEFHRMSVRCATLKLNEFENFSWNFLRMLPNLEELTITDKELGIYAFRPAEKYFNDLSKLKSLDMNLRLLRNFNSKTKNCHNLKNLTVRITSKYNLDELTDFIAQQKNLQNLFLDVSPELKLINFPTSDIATKLKFQLKKFKFNMKNGSNESEHFLNFFESLAPSLEIIKLNFNPDYKFTKIILKNCKNLKKIDVSQSRLSGNFGQNLNRIWKLPSVQTIQTNIMDREKMKIMLRRFPNATKIKCKQFLVTHGRFNKIKEIKTDYIECLTCSECELPNLKTLYVKEIVSGGVEQWVELTKSIKNLENLTIVDFLFFDRSEIGFKHLSNLKNLKVLNFMGFVFNFDKQENHQDYLKIDDFEESIKKSAF